MKFYKKFLFSGTRQTLGLQKFPQSTFLKLI
nr:MAG TPA: hypothetical protein [Caudoviricetes sp.]